MNAVTVLIKAAICSVLLFAVATMASDQAAALAVPSKPQSIPIVDQTNTLTDDQQQQLATTIADERTATGNQIAIVVISTLDGDALEDYSLRIAREWGIGSSERDSGALLLVVKDDRKVRIEVGYGLEGALTDIRSNQIIRQRIAPQFQQENYFAGIQSGLDGIITAIHNEVDPQLASTTEGFSWASVPWEFVLFLSLAGFSWLGSMLGRTKSWWLGGIVGGVIGTGIALLIGFTLLGFASIIVLGLLGLVFDKAVSANYKSHARRGDAPSWWAGGPYIGGGGSSGGGFGGFGGGGFGGGGSSGSW